MRYVEDMEEERSRSMRKKGGVVVLSQWAVSKGSVEIMFCRATKLWPDWLWDDWG